MKNGDEDFSRLDKQALLARKEATQREIFSLEERIATKDTQPLRIGLLGVRGACKSSLLASLYMFGREDFQPGLPNALVASWYRNGSNIDLKPDEHSMAVLREIAKDIEQNGTATATANAVPELLRFWMQLGQDAVAVETLDFSGYFLEPMGADDELRELAEESRDFMRQCDAILCLVNWNEDALDTNNALDICFPTLRNEHTTLILALTKFDERWEAPQNADEEAEIIEYCFRENESLRHLQKRLKNRYASTSDEFVTTLIAPLGHDFAAEPTRLPLLRQDIRPFNIAGPLTHAFTHRQHVLQRMESQIGLRIHQIADIDKALSRLKELEQDRELEQLRCRFEFLAVADFAGPDAADVDQEIEMLSERAKDLQDTRLAYDLFNLISERKRRHLAARKQQLKRRFAALMVEFKGGTWLSTHQHLEALEELSHFAQAIDDDDIGSDIAVEMRRLKSRRYLVDLMERTGLKTFEGVVYFAIVVLALIGAGVTAYVVHLVVRS